MTLQEEAIQAVLALTEEEVQLVLVLALLALAQSKKEETRIEAEVSA